MTYQENLTKNLERLKRKFPSFSDDVLLDELEMATDVINSYRNFTPTVDIRLEEKYYTLQYQMAIESLAKEGAEGEKSHGENGITRNYDNASPYSMALLSRIVPRVKGLTQ